MRRRALIGSSLCLAAPPLHARGVIELVTADDHPYAIAIGPEPGIALTLSAELFRMVGLQVVFRFLPWADAEARAASVQGLAIAPITRTPAREARFRWAVPLFDGPSGFATLRQRAPDSLAEARELPQIVVLSGSPHEAYLAGRGFTNLLARPGRPEAKQALRAHQASAWFCELPKLRAHLGPSAQLGRPIFTEPAWLALHPATDDVPIATLRKAHAGLEADGSLQYMLRPFIGSGA
jgi:polar amino acid transport system substrate-binding protein